MKARMAAVACATSADGATLTVVSDKANYAPGEIVTLTIRGDDGGATAYGIYGRLIYDAALTSEGSRTQTRLVGPSGAWTLGSLPASDGTSVAFDQISTFAQSANNLPGVLAIVTLIFEGVGLVSVDWDTTSPGFELDFFGLTSAPGTSFAVVPEPAPGALLGLGLSTLIALRRRERIRLGLVTLGVGRRWSGARNFR